MSSDGWDEMKRAKEEAYFDRQNKEAMDRLKNRQQQKPRLSPITGQPLEQVTLQGIVIDRCPTSGGIWLDAGELEQIIKLSKEQNAGKSDYTMEKFFGGLLELVGAPAKKK